MLIIKLNQYFKQVFSDYTFLLSGVSDILLWFFCIIIAFRINVQDHLPSGWIASLLTCLVLSLIRETLQLFVLGSHKPNIYSVRKMLSDFLYTFFLLSSFTVLLYFMGIYGGIIIFLFYFIITILSDWEFQTSSLKQITDADFDKIMGNGLLKRMPKLFLLPDKKPVIYSKSGRRRAIMVSSAILDAPFKLKAFLYFHELGHFFCGHFWRMSLFRLEIFGLLTMTPFITMFFISSNYLYPHNLPNPIHYLPALFSLSVVNLLSSMAENRITYLFEKEADQAAIKWTQNPHAARAALELFVGKKEIDSIGNYLLTSKKFEFLDCNFPAHLSGQKWKHLTYCCTTYRCNALCIFCASDKTGKGKIPFVEVDEFRNFLAQDKGPHQKITLSGGEPLVHPSIQTLIDISSEKYDEVCLMTNGLLLAQRNTASRLLSKGKVTEIAIPVYGANDASHDLITRTPGSFNKLIRAMENIKNNTNAKLHLKLLYSKPTLSENLKILDAIQRGRIPAADFISLTHIIWGQRAVKMTDTLHPPLGESFERLDELVCMMCSFPFSLNYIPLCWLKSDTRLKVLQKEKPPPSVIHLYYTAPDKKPYFKMIIPDELAGCKECALYFRCNRFYSGDEPQAFKYRSCHPIVVNECS